MRIGLIIFTLWCFYLMKHAKGIERTNAIVWESETNQT